MLLALLMGSLPIEMVLHTRDKHSKGNLMTIPSSRLVDYTTTRYMHRLTPRMVQESLVSASIVRTVLCTVGTVYTILQ